VASYNGIHETWEVVSGNPGSGLPHTIVAFDNVAKTITLSAPVTISASRPLSYAIASARNPGQSASPYRYQAWFLDPADLARVAAGQKTDHTVAPYAIWTTIGSEWPAGSNPLEKLVVGATFDRVHHRLYLLQCKVWGTSGSYPMVHVYQVGPA